MKVYELEERKVLLRNQKTLLVLKESKKKRRNLQKRVHLRERLAILNGIIGGMRIVGIRVI